MLALQSSENGTGTWKRFLSQFLTGNQIIPGERKEIRTQREKGRKGKEEKRPRKD
jgi:hypothetical protein